MQKSTEERLADIESNINRLTKMESCVFKALLILRKTVQLFETRESTSTSVIVSLESYRQHGNRFLALIFGAITVMAFGTSMLALYFATLNSNLIVMFIVCFVLFFVLFLFGFLEYRSANSQYREGKKELTQTKEIIDIVRKEEAVLDDALAQVVAEWKKLIPDDLVSEPKSEE